MRIFFMIIFALYVYTYIDNRIISCYSFNTNKKVLRGHGYEKVV